MAEQNDDAPICECHMMEILSETPAYPVKYDDERGAYFLSNGIAFRHCMSCGGSLPKPKYADAVEPDPSDKREAVAVVESSASLEEMINVLGKPDELVSAADSAATGFVAAMYRVHERYPATYINDPNCRWTRYARYASKWPSLCFDVYEYPDGRLESSVTGLGPNQFVILERRPWWSRFLPHRTNAT